MKTCHFPLMSQAEDFVDTAIQTAQDTAENEGHEVPQFYLNHATHSNTFIVIFSDAMWASWMVTYEKDDVQAHRS